MTDPIDSLPDATRPRRVALRVADRDETTAFYRDVAGLDVRSATDAATTLGVADAPLLDLVADPDARPRDRREAGLFHVAVRLPDRASLGAAVRRVRDRWTLDGASDHGFSEALYLSDPEGNGVELYRDRPRERWPREDDGRLRTDTTPLDLDALAAAADADANAGSETEPGAPAGTRIGHVHLETTSVADARAFYADALGFDVSIDARPSALFFAVGGYHHHLAVNEWNRRTRPVREGTRGLAWIEFAVPDATAIDGIRERLGDGATVRDVESGIEVADPDGIRLRFVAE